MGRDPGYGCEGEGVEDRLLGFVSGGFEAVCLIHQWDWKESLVAFEPSVSRRRPVGVQLSNGGLIADILTYLCLSAIRHIGNR